MSYVRARVKKNKSAERLNRRLQRWRTIVCGRAASERAQFGSMGTSGMGTDSRTDRTFAQSLKA